MKFGKHDHMKQISFLAKDRFGHLVPAYTPSSIQGV